MATLQLSTYRYNDINAYLLKVGDDIGCADFGSPASEEDQDKAHRSKAHNVLVNLADKSDGIYKYKEAVEHRTKYGWLLLKNGEIEEEYDEEPKEPRAVLPELEGTSKQIAWAETIRAAYIKSIGDSITDWSPQSAAYECLETLPDAKSWIDNRDRLKPQKFIDRVKALEEEWAAVESSMALEDAIDSEISESRITRDDEVLDEAEIYAVVYEDRIEIQSNVTGAKERIPTGGKYCGGRGDMKWEYPLDRLDDILKCRDVEFCLDSSGNKIAMKNGVKIGII